MSVEIQHTWKSVEIGLQSTLSSFKKSHPNYTCNPRRTFAFLLLGATSFIYIELTSPKMSFQQL